MWVSPPFSLPRQDDKRSGKWLLATEEMVSPTPLHTCMRYGPRANRAGCSEQTVLPRNIMRVEHPVGQAGKTRERSLESPEIQSRSHSGHLSPALGFADGRSRQGTQ